MSETGPDRSDAKQGSATNDKAAYREPWLPPRLQAIFDRIAAFWRRTPIPVKVFAAAMVATVVAIGAFYTIEPMVREDAVLFSHLDSEDAAAIVQKLKTQQIKYTLTGDGTTIRVPQDKVHELRLEMAGDGLPRGGQVGFEGFEKLRLGATEFEQHVTYRRAMEGELGRTIASVRGIRNARVHLVMPKRSVFTKKQEAASASVVVKLTGGRLDPEEVQSIVNLVASAVASLETDRVTLVTTDGTMLHRPKPKVTDGEDMDASSGDRMAQNRAFEALLEERTRTMLENVLGAGHVDVRVRADVDTAKLEEKSDVADPEKSVLLSESELVERAGGGGPDGVAADTVAGVPGALANIPGGGGLLGEEGEAGALGNTIRRSHTRNYHVTRVQERRVSVTQSVKRLAVAVIVDGVKPADGNGKAVPRSAEELAKLALLVRSSVGFDEDRGDTVTIESVPFYLSPEPEEVAEEHLLPIPEAYREKAAPYFPLARYLGIAIVGLLAFFWIRRKLRKRRSAYQEKVLELNAARKLRAIEEVTAEIAALKSPAKLGEEEPANVDYRNEALRRAAEDPATAALIMQNWLGTAGLAMAEKSEKSEEAAA